MTSKSPILLNIAFYQSLLFLIISLVIIFFSIRTFINSKKWKKVIGKTSNVDCIKTTNTRIYRRGVRINSINNCVMDLTYEVDDKKYMEIYP